MGYVKFNLIKNLANDPTRHFIITPAAARGYNLTDCLIRSNQLPKWNKIRNIGTQLTCFLVVKHKFHVKKNTDQIDLSLVVATVRDFTIRKPGGFIYSSPDEAHGCYLVGNHPPNQSLLLRTSNPLETCFYNAGF